MNPNALPGAGRLFPPERYSDAPCAAPRSGDALSALQDDRDRALEAQLLPFRDGSSELVLFERDVFGWNQAAVVFDPTTDEGGVGGIALTDVTLAVGRPSDDDLGSSAGAVHVYEILPELGYPNCTPQVNSTGRPAQLVATGSDVVADNDLLLTACDVPNHSVGLFLLSASSDFLPFYMRSQGHLCLGVPVIRFSQDVVFSGSADQVSLGVDLTDLPQGTVIQAGETWYFQLWFRDVIQGPTSNFSNGLGLPFR